MLWPCPIRTMSNSYDVDSGLGMEKLGVVMVFWSGAVGRVAKGNVFLEGGGALFAFEPSVQP